MPRFPQLPILPNSSKCEECGLMVSIGASPFCKDGHSMEHTLFHSGYTAYIDEHIAPPPGRDFSPRGLPEYDHKREGYVIKSHDDVRKLMKRNRSDYRGKKRGMKGQEI